jgi:HAE1 family hydrophobic/amphiphilic exporter-1
VSLSDISIDRPVFALMLTLGLVVLGLISLDRLEMQMDPDTEFPFVVVRAELRGASPETVEAELTDILEEHINSLEGIRSLRSTSSEGFAEISIEFGLDHDVDVKLQEVRDKIALSRPELPLDIEEPLVQKFDLGQIPILTVVLGGQVPLRDLSDFAEHEVADRFERIGGVGGVTIVGAREREIRIWLDPLRLTGYGLAIEDVATTLRRENAEFASGRIEGNEREWSVTTQGKVRTVGDFGDLIVAERAGRLVRLRDAAVVEDGLAEARTIARLDGKPGVALEIRRQSGGDAVGIAREVRAEVESIRATLPEGMEIHLARDYATYIEDQVRSVFIDMLVATCLVVMVVLLFLRSGRSTLIAALAIPSSVIASFTLFYAMGLSLNGMTLIALSLAIGLVIDDAVVVLESIFRRLEAGDPPMEAARSGARLVGLAVVSTTLAVCAVFVPITFMQSVIGRYFYEFGVAVTVAVCVSTLVALTLTPMLASRLLSHGALEGPFAGRLDWFLVIHEQAYGRILGWAMRHRAATVGIAIVAIAGGCGVASTLPFDLYSHGDLGEVAVTLELPVGTPLTVTDRTLRRLEEVAAGHPEVAYTFASAGGRRRRDPHRGRLDVFLIDKSQRRPIEETFDDLRARLQEAAPELERLSVGYPSYGSSDGGGGFSSLSYSLRGPELDRLERYANALVARMRADPLFADAASSYESGKPQLTLEIVRGSAADLGVPASSIGRTIRTLLAGEEVGAFEDAGRRYDVRVQVLPAYRDDPSKIDLIRVRSLRGELVPIRNVARVREESGPVEIRRRDRAREITVGANLRAGVPLGDGAVKIEAWGRELGIEAPDELVAGGGVETMAETAADIVFAFALALVAIYMVLASLFNSLVHPLTIMISAPLSFLGGFLALKLAGMSLDMMSGIGVLVLMGLVMKNGILLVDYIGELRRQGRTRREAILEAGPIRMRPVLMTSGALIGGMLPAVFSSGTGSEFFKPMAVIMIGGLITSTLLTLIVVPVLYSLLDAATERALALTRRLRPNAERASSGAS